MRIFSPKIYSVLCAVALSSLGGCTHVSHVALLSDAELAGKSLATIPPGPTLKGKDCARLFRPPQYYLSAAFREATKGSDYDTLVDVKITTWTGFLVTSNCIQVQGQAVKSRDLAQAEVVQ